MVKRYQHRDFLDNEPLASERAVVFVFQLYPDPLIPLDQRGLVDETLFLGSDGSQSTCVSYKTLVCCHQNQLSIKLIRIGPF